MARLARVVAPGVPHHVTQRGNRRQPTFFCDDDYVMYLELMAQWCTDRGVEVWVHCLMPNHVHLIAVPESEDGLRRESGDTESGDTIPISARLCPGGGAGESGESGNQGNQGIRGHQEAGDRKQGTPYVFRRGCAPVVARKRRKLDWGEVVKALSRRARIPNQGTPYVFRRGCAPVVVRKGRKLDWGEVVKALS